MDTLRLLLWLSVAATVLQVYCAADPSEGKENGKPKGCAVGPSRPCGKNNQFRCRQILKQPENGGTPCPPEVERNDPDRPAEHNHPCTVGTWSGCFPLPVYPSIMVRTREPVDMTAVMSTCPHLIEACPTTIPINCVMTEWSVWYQFPAHGVEVRVRFVMVEPQNGGTPCPLNTMESRSIGTGGCTYTGFSAWIPFNVNKCYRFRTSTNGCDTDYEVKDAPCGTGTACVYTTWSIWYTTSSGCLRVRQVVPPSPPATCIELTDTKPPPCDDTCVYTAWSIWYTTSSGCLRVRQLVPPSPPATCIEFTDTKPPPCDDIIPCPWTYTAWGIYTLDPCRQRRYGTNPCYATVTEYRDCLEVCAVPPMSAPLQSRGVPLEGRAAPGHLGKRNEPWCPEEMWIIWGRSDGCTAVTNGTYYMCTETVCQDCAAPATSGLICIPNKFIELTIHLENCPVIGTDTMVLIRPMECTCHQVVADTCTEFDGDCA